MFAMNNPLVSIVVVTYNSSKYVLETLESVKKQTYQNIELVVTDDCSKDNTVEIIKDWVDKNKERFVRTHLVEASANSGVTGNCNRGCNASQGEYIKTIAGDDILEVEAVTEFMKYVNANKSVSLIYAQVTLINEKSEITEFVNPKIVRKRLTFNKEFQSNMVHAPGIFFSRAIYDKVNGFDENLKLEDIDYYLKILDQGGIIEYMEKPVAFYRIHSQSLSQDYNLMLQEHVKTLDKYRKRKHYKWNYIKFTENALFKQKADNPNYNFFKLYQFFSHDHQFVFLIFLDLYFWMKYFFKMRIKKLLKLTK